MACATLQRRHCVTCKSKGASLICAGCHALFCLEHFRDHRNELTAQVDTIESHYNRLQQTYDQHESQDEHPLFSQIDVWGADAIARIQQTTTAARQELRQLLDQSKKWRGSLLEQSKSRFSAERQTDSFTEIEITAWLEQFETLKREFQVSCEMELVPDRNVLPIYLIKVNLAESNQGMTSPASSVNNRVPKAYEETRKKQAMETICNSRDAIAREPSIFLDLTENQYLVLLQASSVNHSPLPSILRQLSNQHLRVFDRDEECLNQLRSGERTTIFLDVSPNEQNRLVASISDFDNVYSMYIRGTPPEEEEDQRRMFFERYPKIKAMFDSEQRLMVQWVLGTAVEYKRTGDMHVERGEIGQGRACFEHGVALYRRLSVYLHEKRRLH